MLRKCSINIKLDNGDFAMPKFNQSYFVTGHDIDLNYRMVPMSALAYFEDCFARYAASKYLAAFDIAGQGLYWVISEIDIRFEGDLPFWSESFQVDLWISEKSKIKIFCDFTMSYRGKVFARGNSCWLVLDKNRKRPAATTLLDGKMDVVWHQAITVHFHIMFYFLLFKYGKKYVFVSVCKKDLLPIVASEHYMINAC